MSRGIRLLVAMLMSSTIILLLLSSGAAMERRHRHAKHRGGPARLQPPPERRFNCVTSVRVGASVAAGNILFSPWPQEHSFYFVSNPSDMALASARQWTPILLNASRIPFDASGGPSAMPELGWTAEDTENMRAKYVKILSHTIPELRACNLVLYMDSKIQLTNAQAAGMFAKIEKASKGMPGGACAALVRHWRTFHGAFFQEVDDSYNQPRYLRFKLSIDKQIEHHRQNHESFDGVMHLGNLHVFNLTHADAVRLQNSWWEETVTYSIQDQLSQFWQLEPFKGCLLSWTSGDW